MHPEPAGVPQEHQDTNTPKSPGGAQYNKGSFRTSIVSSGNKGPINVYSMIILHLQAHGVSEMDRRNPRTTRDAKKHPGELRSTQTSQGNQF